MGAPFWPQKCLKIGLISREFYLLSEGVFLILKSHTYIKKYRKMPPGYLALDTSHRLPKCTTAPFTTNNAYIVGFTKVRGHNHSNDYVGNLL